MLFLTYWFVFFLIALYPIYWAVRNPTARLLVLFLASAVFHTHFAGPAGVLPILVLAVAAYAAGLSRNRLACGLTVVLCVAALVFYKYTRFLCLEVVGAISPEAREFFEGYQPLLELAAPLAISFFVFEFVHYLVDVCRGSPSIKSPLDFALYSIFWPSIVAGPVKRYQDFLPALHEGTGGTDQYDVAGGMLQVALGLVKKLVADNLTAYVAFWGQRYDSLPLTERWFLLGCIAFRILLDFSGYSDMAIGYARMHGIRLPKNFDWPYLATSLTSFWRRWHISLSTWIRDYIYIALGGGRCGPARKIGNGLLAFGLCGLWHGAGWNFLFWGVYHGAGLAVSSNYRSLGGPAGRWLGRCLDRGWMVSWAATMLFVAVGWLFFFYPLPQAFSMLCLLFQTR